MVITQNAALLHDINDHKKRLFEFIKKRVPDNEDAEDIFQDVFFQFVQAARELKPIEQITNWLFTVARNKIIDLYRKKRPKAFSSFIGRQGKEPELFDLLDDPNDHPEVRYYRSLIQAELEVSIDLLPEDQRSVFLAHEIDGLSFKKISKETGIGINTLLSRKRYAVLFLRARLKKLYQETFNDE